MLSTRPGIFLNSHFSEARFKIIWVNSKPRSITSTQCRSIRLKYKIMRYSGWMYHYLCLNCQIHVNKQRMWNLPISLSFLILPELAQYWRSLFPPNSYSFPPAPIYYFQLSNIHVVPKQSLPSHSDRRRHPSPIWSGPKVALIRIRATLV